MEIPIIRYRIVQTGPNIQLGGEKDGLFRVEYQVGIEAKVKGMLITPISSQTAIEVISLMILFTTNQYIEQIYSNQHSLVA